MAKKGEVPVEGAELDNDHKEPRVYELGFHIDPELGAEEVKKVYQGIKDKISAVATVITEGEPQKIQLAYTISRSETGGRRDFDASYFAWIAYEANGEAHEKVGEVARAESRIVRFLDILTTKESAEHSAQIHEMMQKASAKDEADEETEEVSDEEIDQALKEVTA